MLINTIAISIVFLSGLSSLLLAIYVYKKNPKAKLNQNFLYFGFIVSLWCFADFVTLLSRDLFWFKANNVIGSAVPVAGLFFAYALANKKMGNWFKIFLFLFCAAIFIVDFSGPLLVKNVVYFYDLGSEIIFGPVFNIWSICIIVLTLAAIFIPLSVIKEVDSQRKKQILYYTVGEIMFAVWAVTVSVILPLLGFTRLSAFGSSAMIFLIGFTSYAIIKYHLMEISSLFFKAFIYSFVIVFIVAFLLLLMFVGFSFFEQSLMWPIYVIAVLISIVLFLIGRLFFIEKSNLEKAKNDLIELLKKSEENRVKAEIERDKTATIVSSFTDSLIIINDKNEIFSINPEAEKILELDKNKLLEKSFQAMADFPKAKPLMSILDSELKNISRKEVELSKGFIVEMSVIPLNLDKNNIGHLIVLHDVSREKLVEKMKTEFVSLAAHQLRTPLSIIKWSMSMLKKGDFGKLTKKQSDIVKSTFQNNERLISLVSDLLDVTHIEEGRYLYKVSETDIRKIIELAINNYKEEAKRRKIKIDFEKPETFPLIMLDIEKMKLAIQNFIDNAIKYSKDGGKIMVTLKNDEGKIELKVQDFGMGIPEEQQNKIFNKFFRGDNARKVNTVGSGLGLFLSKNIVEAHGGKMWFESKENVGTSFYFSLPIKK